MSFRDVSEQMAFDQALFETSRESGEASARFYHWDSPAVTVGYFHQFEETVAAASPPVRRFTGGGIVEHGRDLTFVIALPSESPLSRLPGNERYYWVHSALVDALRPTGFPVVLETSATPSGTGPCFSTPVTWDLLCPKTGEKIGGGAQRRSSGSVMHQGSIRLPTSLRSPEAPWVLEFLSRLAEETVEMDGSEIESLNSDARHWQQTRFSTEEWNRWSYTVTT